MADREVVREVRERGSDGPGVVAILAILLLVLIGGFFLYRVFAQPGRYETTPTPGQDSGYVAPPQSATGTNNSTTTTVIDNNVASGTLQATTTTTN